MFVSSTKPPGTSAIQALRQRTTDHVETNDTVKTTSTRITTNGNSSVETPPEISSPPQSRSRIQNSDQRAVTPVPSSGSASRIVCMTSAVVTAAPIASPPSATYRPLQRVCVSTHAPPNANIEATSNDGISSTQLVLSSELTTGNWTRTINPKVIHSSSERM